MSESQTQDVVEATASGEQAAAEPVMSAEASEDAVYDDAVAEMLDETPADQGDEAAGGEEGGEQPAAASAGDQTADNTLGFQVSDDDQALFMAHNLDADALAGLPEAQVQAIAAALRQNQTAVDGGQQEQTASNEPAEPAEGSLRHRIGEARDKLIEAYDEEFKPVVELLDAVATETEQLQAAAKAIPVMNQIIEGMAVDAAIAGLGDRYPDAAKRRDALVDRFYAEIKTRANTNAAEQPMDRIRGAMEDAAKHVFAATPEDTARRIATTNEKRVRSQPPRGRTQRRKPPQSEDDVYDQAYEDTIGKAFQG